MISNDQNRFISFSIALFLVNKSPVPRQNHIEA